jgi:hypothetical protein
MRNRPKTQRGPYFVPATIPGARPGDFPIGSLQSRAEARAILAGFADKRLKEEADELAKLTPSERASIRATMEDVDNPLVRAWMIKFFRVAQERARVYERPLPLPTPEEIRQRRAAAKKLDG